MNIYQLLEKHSPVKTIKVKNDEPPWMSNEIRLMLNKRDKARVKSLKTKDPYDCKLFKELRNQTKQQCRNARVKYYHEVFDGNKSPSKLWATIRSLGMGKPRKNCADNFPVSAYELNKHYLNVPKIDYTELAKETEAIYNEMDCDTELDNLFHFKFVPAKDIHKIIMNFKSIAVGVDGISLTFVKMFQDVIIYVLEHILNFCLQSSVFPSLWKCANQRSN